MLMKYIRKLIKFISKRGLWVFVIVVTSCCLIWFFGPLLKIGESAPLTTTLNRILAISAIVLLYLLSILIRQIRTARANRAFVDDLSADKSKPGEENIAEVNKKFAGILAEMKRSKLGGRKFLRDMPWYIFIGPPGTGKTTALRQSGLDFPIDLSDDIKGVGGTRNCDWFFTEDAVLIDTAGRYVEQGSEPEVDAAEWLGFLNLLKKHRGKRALNGVIVAISMVELAGDDASIRTHGREVRKRLAELKDRLQVQLPVYLMITKADLIPGFEGFFDDLSQEARGQVWGVTLPPDGNVGDETVREEFGALIAKLESRLLSRMGDKSLTQERAEVFRFPAQVDRRAGPIRLLVDTIFGTSKYEDSPWLRGFYLSSATQEGSPIDRLVGQLSAGFGIETRPAQRRMHGEKRSYFLNRLMTDVIFKEAGLASLDRRAVERMRWIWRGTLAVAGLASISAGIFFSLSYLQFRNSVEAQALQFDALQARLSSVAVREVVSRDEPDLDEALEAVTEVASRVEEPPSGFATILGPSAAEDITRSQQIAYERVLKNVLEPRMVAVLEATMWRQIHDPEYLLGALKVYQMLTHQTPFNVEFAQEWWLTQLPLHAPVNVFPTEAAAVYQVEAIERMSRETNPIEPDPKLIVQARDSICEIPLSRRAYNTLLADPRVSELPEWDPRRVSGPNAEKILRRVSGKSLRVGLPGAFTYDGFHETIVAIVPEIAEQAAIDREVFSGGCEENAAASIDDLQTDIFKLYYDDFIANWDGLLRDIRLAPIEDLRVATDNLKDLSSDDSTLRRLLAGVVAETNLLHVEESAEADTSAAKKKAGSAVLKRLGAVGGLIRQGQSILPASSGGPPPDPPGTQVANHFAPIRATIEEVDGNPPLLNDATTAMKALANQLQSIIVLPNPESVVLAQGGLSGLTGAVAKEAENLPDPVDDWIAGIAGDTRTVTLEAVLGQLNDRWKNDVLGFCTTATAGRFPFNGASGIDVSLFDFGKLFAPGGLIDTFTNEELAQYIDTTARPWAWRSDVGLNNDLLIPFERARRIRDGLFAGGSQVPVMSFSLNPLDLTGGAARVSLNVAGQRLEYAASQINPVQMQWPGREGSNFVNLSFFPLDGSPEALVSRSGSWAWLRMIRTGRLRSTAQPELFRLTLSSGGMSVVFDLQAASVVNPFDLEIFESFKCPSGF